MARGRMINTTIALDPEFNAMSAEAQLCFLRAVPHLDRDGLIIGQPAALWATIAPLLPSLMPSMPGIINEWQNAGLVIVFETKIGPVFYFDGFHRNQVGMRYDREPESRYPLPSDCERTPDGIRIISGNVPASIRQVSGNVPPDDGKKSARAGAEVEVEVEVEVEDQEEGEKAPAAPATTHPAVPPAVNVFREVHQRFPKKSQYPSLERITDLDRWRQVCQEWRDRGYNVTNISGPLDWYDDPKRMAHQNGKPLSKSEQSMANIEIARQMAKGTH